MELLVSMSWPGIAPGNWPTGYRGGGGSTLQASCVSEASCVVGHGRATAIGG